MTTKPIFIDPKFMVGDQVVFRDVPDKIIQRTLVNNKYWLYHLEEFTACSIHEDCLEFLYGSRHPVQWAAYHRSILKEHEQVLSKITSEGRWLLNRILDRCSKQELTEDLNLSVYYVNGLLDGNTIQPEIYERLISLYEKHYLFLLEPNKNES
jgi:hypothetical protein